MTQKKIQAVRGMNDLLPSDSPFWQFVESKIKSVLNCYGYKEIRTPILEQTALFKRAVGEVTDIVEKEMYTFNDRNDESMTLRPELTAGCVRMGNEHGLFYNQEQRLWYYGTAFRYERPQKGRYRQFHQFGVEVFGLSGPEIDVELIMMTARIWSILGIQNHVKLHINSIGSNAARVNYKTKLVDYLESHYEQLDDDCKRRLTMNPLRILDSKNPALQEILNAAPKLIDCLDVESKQHFDQICHQLSCLGIDYEINPRLVRGLDYYNKTVFEWITDDLGAQGTVCGGGRYDGLVEQLGGKSTPAIGFGLGAERLMLLIETVNPALKPESYIDVYIVSAKSEQETIKPLNYAQLVAESIREQSELSVMMDYGSSNLKKQLSKADKLNASIAIIIGDDEVNNNAAIIKHLKSGMQETVLFSDIANHCIKLVLKGV